MDNVADFYHEVTYNDLVTKATFDEEGVELTPDIFVERIETELKPRPECKSMEALERVISLRKPQSVVDKFIQFVINSEQWGWFDSYNEYLIEKEEVETYNSDLPVVGQDDNGDDILAEPKELPVEPIKPSLLTLEGFKSTNNSVFNSYKKHMGVSINGVAISSNKENADGIVSIKAAYDIIGDAVFPTNFMAETPNGIVAVPFNSYENYIDFTLQFIAARQVFFN